MMNTTEILVTMNNTMFMQVDGGFVIGSLISPVKYLIDKSKIGFIKHSRYRMCSTAVPQDNYGMKQEIALYIFSTMRRKRK